jgi:hypothetical protein
LTNRGENDRIRSCHFSDPGKMYLIRGKRYQLFFDLPILTPDCPGSPFSVHSDTRICSHLDQKTGTMSYYRTASGWRGFLGSGFSEGGSLISVEGNFKLIQGYLRRVTGQSKNVSRSVEEFRSSPLSDLMTFEKREFSRLPLPPLR